MADELLNLDATAQAELVRSGKASPRELVDAAIARLERVNPQLNAVIRLRYEKARAEEHLAAHHSPHRDHQSDDTDHIGYRASVHARLQAKEKG